MTKKEKLDVEQEINEVIKYHDEQLKNMHSISNEELDDCIAKSEGLLKKLGHELPSMDPCFNVQSDNQNVVVRSWSEICEEANKYVSGECEIESLFTEEELRQNSEAIKIMNKEFNEVYMLDKVDIAICILAGVLAATVEMLMVGIPQRSPEGLKAKPLSNLIRDYFNKKFSPEEMEKLANSKISKVPYDAQDNRNTTIDVEGLSSYYHRLLQLGHDPILGFVFGVADIMSGRMTTIDKNGKIVSQLMENYASRTESDIFNAIAKQIVHLKSDITTSMGLPAPFMSLFNLLQFGKIGESEQTIAEIVQGMYYEGYDFIHFCTLSIPVMLIEVVVRVGYAFKRINEGNSIKDSIPVSLDRVKKPKLATMLFLAHSITTGINAGEVIFSKNPMVINYPEWLAFAKYSFQQLKWAVLEKPSLRDSYINGKIYEEISLVFDTVNNTFNEYTRDKIVIYK